jgi:hypothetical protein
MGILEYFVGAIGIVFGFMALLVIIELYVRRKQNLRAHKNLYTLLSIRVARDNEAGPLVAEQIFSTIHGIARKISFWHYLKGYDQDRVSFEIANVERSIKFYVHFPSRLRNVVEGQIYAQYPNIEIVEVPDYTIFKESIALNEDYAVGAELGLNDPSIYPIKRYPQFEDKKAKFSLDPLAAITSTLAKFNNANDQAWIQIVVKPLEDKWRVVFTKCIRILNKGIYLNIESLQKFYANAFCSRSKIIRIVFFPLYWLFFLQGLKSGTKSLNFAGAGDKGETVDTQISRSHEKESSIIAAIDKVGKLLYETNIRITYLPEDKDREASLIKMREIAGAYKQFNIPHLNGFEVRRYYHGKEAVALYKERKLIDPFVLNVEELATVYHMPNVTVTTPNIYWVRSKKLEPPGDLPCQQNSDPGELTTLGKINFRSSNFEFGVKEIDRRRHIYIIGKTGMGKSTLLENMIFSDIQAGKGVAVVDPHGDLADAVLNFVPSNRTNDVVIFDPSDRDFPVAFNMLENIDPTLNSIVCSGLVGIFKKIWVDSWGPRLEHILRNTILSLLSYPNTTMLGIPRMLQDKDFRSKVVRKISDPIVKAFWLAEFDKMELKMRVEAISPILNKVGQFLSSPIVRNILGQPNSAIDLRFAMDHKKIVVVNLSKGKIGEDISSLLGSMIITKFQLDAMSRANIPEKDRVDFYLYVDEFQNFATDSFATILSEARKYKLNLTMANQYIAQMPEEVRDAVFGNVGSVISFQVGFDDADTLSNQFGEEVLPPDLVSLSKFTAYSRLLIDGMPSKTFSMSTMPPPTLVPEDGRKEKIIRLSRERYATPREVVEDKIQRWSEGGFKEEENG